MERLTIILFLTLVLLAVYIKNTKSKSVNDHNRGRRKHEFTKPKQHASVRSVVKGKGKGPVKGAIRCNEHDDCPDGYACLFPDFGKVPNKRCYQCNCMEPNQCFLQQRDISCNCSGSGFTGEFCETIIATDCLDLLNAGINTNGIYEVNVGPNNMMIEVYCDMETDGGGWIVFQNRFDGSLYFNRTFNDYEFGFGDLNQEFWLGLKYVQMIAAEDETTLRIEMSDVNDTLYFREYTDFSLTTSLYVLNIGVGSWSPLLFSFGTLNYHNGMAFTTIDSDNDLNPNGNCAEILPGGWWFNFCSFVHLNGLYLTPGEANTKGIVHRGFSVFESFKTSRMMMRRSN